jgi:hypothetical protein
MTYFEDIKILSKLSSLIGTLLLAFSESTLKASAIRRLNRIKSKSSSSKGQIEEGGIDQ